MLLRGSEIHYNPDVHKAVDQKHYIEWDTTKAAIKEEKKIIINHHTSSEDCVTMRFHHS